MELQLLKSMIICGQRYDYLENIYKDGTKILVRYLPHIGYGLYRVNATYAKSLKPSVYYVIARSRNEARQLFVRRFSWLNVISSIDQVGSDQENHILENPKSYTVL